MVSIQWVQVENESVLQYNLYCTTDKGLHPVIFFFGKNRPLIGDFDSLWVGEYESRKKIGGL